MTVVLRGPSAAVLGAEGSEDSGGLRIAQWESTIGPVTIAYRTRSVVIPDGAKVSGHLWIEIQERPRV